MTHDWLSPAQWALSTKSKQSNGMSMSSHQISEQQCNIKRHVIQSTPMWLHQYNWPATFWSRKRIHGHKLAPLRSSTSSLGFQSRSSVPRDKCFAQFSYFLVFVSLRAAFRLWRRGRPGKSYLRGAADVAGMVNRRTPPGIINQISPRDNMATFDLAWNDEYEWLAASGEVSFTCFASLGRFLALRSLTSRTGK